MRQLIITAISTVLVSAIFANTSVVLNKANGTSSHVTVEVNSDSDIYGIQFDLKYDPSELSIDPSLIIGAEDVYATDKGNGILRVLMFDFDGQPLHPKSANALTTVGLSPSFDPSCKRVLFKNSFPRVDVASFLAAVILSL